MFRDKPSTFYCANCDILDNNFINNGEYKVSWLNPRDGYGRPIYHIKCPHCGYILSGYIMNNPEDKGWCQYVKYTIGLYSKDGEMLIDHDKLVNQLEADYNIVKHKNADRLTKNV